MTVDCACYFLLGLQLNSLLERAAAAAETSEGTDRELDSLEDDARGMLADKDALLSSVSSSFDVHIAKLLAAEDSTREAEKAHTRDVVAGLTEGEARRNRERVSEIVALDQHLRKEMEALHAELKDDE